ncbi:MAG TPA: aminoglycoside phosphotransferase family protein [Anaerolineales bacterium]|nr:aminoglycoside phosphotransferase family protein [Anaerolineales bacterium]
MLEKPDIPDALIISRLQEEYNLRAAKLTFLPLGADLGTAVYRVAADEGTAYFLKLRKGFEVITVTVPLFLHAQGIQTIIVPFQTESKGHWAEFGEYTMILYPFVDGKDGFERELSDHDRRALGAALKAIHSAKVLPEIGMLLPKESFSPQWRERLKPFQELARNNRFDDPTAAKLAAFLRSKRDEITRLIAQTEGLASGLRSRPLELVLCHSDFHGGNILISEDGSLYIVDWDNPILAPKERDLMFIGGGIDEIWKSPREEAVFFQGYGETDIDRSALAYYRYERIIEDLVVIGEQLLLSEEGGADRERSYGWFTSNFEPGNTIEIADKTVDLLKTSR